MVFFFYDLVVNICIYVFYFFIFSGNEIVLIFFLKVFYFNGYDNIGILKMYNEIIVFRMWFDFWLIIVLDRILLCDLVWLRICFVLDCLVLGV